METYLQYVNINSKVFASELLEHIEDMSPVTLHTLMDTRLSKVELHTIVCASK